MKQLGPYTLNENRNLQTLVKIDGVPKDFDGLPFGRQIEHNRTIKDFMKKAKSQWVGMKGKKGKPEIMKFLKSVGAKEYYVKWQEGSSAKDDSAEVFYK